MLCHPLGQASGLLQPVESVVHETAAAARVNRVTRAATAQSVSQARSRCATSVSQRSSEGVCVCARGRAFARARAQPATRSFCTRTQAAVRRRREACGCSRRSRLPAIRRVGHTNNWGTVRPATAWVGADKPRASLWSRMTNSHLHRMQTGGDLCKRNAGGGLMRLCFSWQGAARGGAAHGGARTSAEGGPMSNSHRNSLGSSPA